MSSGKEKTGSVKQPMVNPNLVKILEAADQLSGQLNRNRVLFEKVIQKAQAVKVPGTPPFILSQFSLEPPSDADTWRWIFFLLLFFQCGVLAAGLCADLGFNWRFHCPGLLFSFFLSSGPQFCAGWIQWNDLMTTFRISLQLYLEDQWRHRFGLQ